MEAIVMNESEDAIYWRVRGPVQMCEIPVQSWGDTIQGVNRMAKSNCSLMNKLFLEPGHTWDCQDPVTAVIIILLPP